MSDSRQNTLTHIVSSLVEALMSGRVKFSNLRVVLIKMTALVQLVEDDVGKILYNVFIKLQKTNDYNI